jgi:hypothetical protein
MIRSLPLHDYFRVCKCALIFKLKIHQVSETWHSKGSENIELNWQTRANTASQHLHIPANQLSPAHPSTLHMNAAAFGVQAYSASTWKLQPQTLIGNLPTEVQIRTNIQTNVISCLTAAWTPQVEHISKVLYEPGTCVTSLQDLFADTQKHSSGFRRDLSNTKSVPVKVHLWLFPICSAQCCQG